MSRLFAGVLWVLLPLLAHAAEVEEAAAPQVIESSPWPLLIFVLVFIGMIGGFGVFIWKKERARKAQEERGS